MRFQTVSVVAMAAAVSAQNGTTTSDPLTTSTVYGTKVYTVTSCAPTVTNCPARGAVTTEIVALYTTVCPVSQATGAPPPPAGGDQCASMCTAAFNDCKSKPNENNSYCVSQYSSCLGYNPFAPGAASPTACVGKPAATSTSTPPATSAPPAGGDKCASMCTAAFTDCKSKPNENNSYCVSQYSSCLGYNPFAPGAASPTACVGTPAVTSTSAPPAGSAPPSTSAPPAAGGDQCASMCTAAFSDCKGKPNENNSYCVSQYSSCLGYNPFAPGAASPTACATATSTATGSVGTVVPVPNSPSSPSTVPFTGAADLNKPVMGLLALGLLAML